MRWRGWLVGCGGTLVFGLALLSWQLWPRPYVNPPTMPMAQRADPGHAPHVVLVIGCTVRRDQLTPYGGPDTTTPFLAELASGGAVFSDAVAASSWTKASTVALITGRHALSLDMVEPSIERNERALDPEITTLAEHFVAAGYETVGATANPNLNTAFGLAQGFDHYRDVDGRIIEGKIVGGVLVERLLDLVDARRAPQRPLYLRAMLVDAHVPRDGLSEAEVAAHRGPEVPPQLAEYRGQLRRFDDALRALAEGLEGRGIRPEETLWVIVADHGEGLDLHPHHRGHGRTLYPSMLRVPWIVRGPGVPAGTEVSGLASLVDLPRTVLALAGVDAEVGGEDWSAQVRGERRETTRERVFADTWFYESRRSAVWSNQVACQRDYGTPALRTDIFFEDGCYDRAGDPGYSRPTAAHPMLAELDAWRAARLQEAANGGASSTEVSRELSEQLEALGYVQ